VGQLIWSGAITFGFLRTFFITYEKSALGKKDTSFYDITFLQPFMFLEIS